MYLGIKRVIKHKLIDKFTLEIVELMGSNLYAIMVLDGDYIRHSQCYWVTTHEVWKVILRNYNSVKKRLLQKDFSILEDDIRK